MPGSARSVSAAILSLLALLIGALGASGCGAHVLAERGAELKVTRAVLYQNGIGYFERRGKLTGDLLRLRVRPDQIRDVLKSLTVVDLSAGRPVSISLPIEKSRAKQLQDLPEQVRAQGGVLAIAQAFRGARCLVEAERTAVGRLVGVEDLGADDKPDWRLTVLADGGGLVQLQVAKVRALKVLEGTLEIGLRKALDVALDSGTWKPVELDVRLSGGGTHDLVVSYVVEMPAWKPAYRVVTQKEGEALLQGWAVVDNVSGDDWEGVRLSLTAGTPLAFTYDLYTPRFPQRPHLEARDEVAQLPPEAFGAVGGLAASADEADEEEEASSKEMDEGKSRSGYGGGGPGRAPARAKKSSSKREMAPPSMSMAPRPKPAAPPPPVTAEALERNFRTLVAGAAVGSLFRYDLADPVTIGERQSALVNVVNARVPGEDVLLFRVGSDTVSPYRAVRFRNDTGFVLEAGPIAIYRTADDGGTFLGEAMAQRMEKGANTFVPYALDGRVRVTLDEAQREEGVTLLKVVRGAITIQNKRITRFSYDVDNGSGETGTLYVRRERRTGWKVVGREKMLEEGGAYYLPIKLPKSGRTRVTIEEETPVTRTVDIFSDLARDVLAVYLKNPAADQRVSAQLDEALKLRERVGTMDAQVRTLEEQRDVQTRRQHEVRENLKVLGKASANADLKKQLEGTLGELERGLNEATRKLVTISMERGALRDRLAVLLKVINLETR